MGFSSNPNQPINFNIIDTSNCDIVADTCATYAVTDGFAFSQIELTPCQTGIECNGDFTNSDPETQIVECWDISTWIINQDPNGGFYISHNAGNADPMYYFPTTPFTSYGNYFSFTITVFDYVQGSLEITFNTELLGTINANGTYTFYGFGTSDFTFIPSIDFIGSIDNVVIDAYFIPPNAEDWISVVNINCPTCQPRTDCTTVNIVNNYATISIDLDCLGVGCWRLKVCDPCLNNIDPQQVWYDEVLDSGLVTITQQGVFDIAYIPHLEACMKAVGTGIFSFSIPIYGNINEGCCNNIRLYYDLVWNENVQLYYQTSQTVNNTPICGDFVTLNPGDNFVDIECCGLFDILYLDIFAEVTDPAELLCIEFKQVVINYTNLGDPDCPFEPVGCQLSNCIQIIDSANTDDTVLITGICDPNTFELGLFWNAFQLKQRLNLFKYAPTYEIDAKDYIFSDGTRKVTSGQRQKFYDVIFKGLNEIQHDTLSTQILCTSFQIGGVEYFVDPKDYKPEWDKKTGYNLADVRIQAMKQGTIIFKANQN